MSDSAEEQIAAGAKAFAGQLSLLSSEPYFREAVVKMSVREFAWALYDAFPDERTTIADQFEGMAGQIESGPDETD